MRTKEIFSWLKFIKKTRAAWLLILLISAYLLVNAVFSVAYYTLCDFNKEMTFFDYFYFSNVTSFSLGYGDLVPVTSLGRFFVILHMIITTLLFAFNIAIMTVKIFHPGDSIIFSKYIYVDRENQKIGFRLLNIHSVPLINPEIRVHCSEHCIGNVSAKVSALKMPDQLTGFLGRHDYICSIDADNDFFTNLDQAALFDSDKQNKVKSRFRVVVAISGENGIQRIAQVKRYYAKDFKDGKGFKQIQYNEEDRKNIIDYSKFGNFEEDFDSVISGN